MKNNLTLAVFLFISSLILAQETKNTWQIGLGTAVTRFNNEDASFIGDKHLFQIPRLNISIPLNERFSVDAAVSFNTIDNFSAIQNFVNYFSVDGSVRYHFKTEATIYPYVFAGASAVKSELKMTPTFNVGAGATHWITDRIGINAQIYYKHSIESFSSMRSHIQGTLSLLYSFDWDPLFGGGGSSRGKCY